MEKLYFKMLNFAMDTFGLAPGANIYLQATWLDFVDPSRARTAADPTETILIPLYSRMGFERLPDAESPHKIVPMKSLARYRPEIRIHAINVDHVVAPIETWKESASVVEFDAVAELASRARVQSQVAYTEAGRWLEDEHAGTDVNAINLDDDDDVPVPLGENSPPPTPDPLAEATARYYEEQRRKREQLLAEDAADQARQSAMIDLTQDDDNVIDLDEVPSDDEYRVSYRGWLERRNLPIHPVLYDDDVVHFSDDD